MKKVLTVGLALLLVSVAGLAMGVGVSAQESEETTTPQEEILPTSGWGHLRAGMGALSEAISDLLGLTPEEIRTEREAGKTLAEIANEQGITDEALIEAIVAGQEEAIEQALAEGTITQEQADWLIAKAEAMAPFQISNPFAPGARRGMHRGYGMRGDPGRLGECPCAPVASEDTAS